MRTLKTPINFGFTDWRLIRSALRDEFGIHATSIRRLQHPHRHRLIIETVSPRPRPAVMKKIEQWFLRSNTGVARDKDGVLSITWTWDEPPEESS